LEGRKKRKCWNCRKFGHLAYNCRTKREKEKRREEKPQNKYKVLTTRVMQYRVRDKVKVRQQEKKKEVKYFRY